MDPYHPVACAFHDLFEIAIMRRQRLRTRWRDAGDNVHEELLIPEDLRIQDGGEYLLAHSAAGVAIRLRLDLIESASPEA